MNAPNLITSARLVAAIGVIGCLEAMRPVSTADQALGWTAFGLFLAAAGSDFVDGWIARRYGLETRLGRVIDPFADKFLICGSLISLLRFTAEVEGLDSCLQTWMVVVIVSREFLVTTLRGMAEAAGVAFPADRLGKLKMVAQCVAVAAMLTMVAGSQIFAAFGLWGMWVTLALTIVSGAGYVLKARPLFKTA